DQPRACASVNMCTKLGSGIPNRVLTPSASNRSRIRLYTGTPTSNSLICCAIAVCESGTMRRRRAEQRAVEGGALEVDVDTALPRVADAAVQLHGLTRDVDGGRAGVRFGHGRGDAGLG